MHTYEEWKDLLESKPKDYEPPELFNNNVDHPKHNFEVGMKVEALCPTDRTKICSATVSKIFDDTYFLVSIDTHVDVLSGSENAPVSNNSEDNTWLCTMEHPYIFPIGWAEKHDIK